MTRFVMAVTAAVALAGAGAAQQTKDFITETAKDFGPSAVGPVHVHYFPIENTTNQPIRIEAPRIGCGCVAASVLKGELAPGEKTFLYATLDTKKIPSHQLNFTKTVSVHVPFVIPGQPRREIKVDVTTVGRQDMSITPEVLAIGTVKKGDSKSAKVTVTLYGNIVWDVTEAKSNGQFVKAEVKKLAGQVGRTTYEVTAILDEKCPTGNWMSDVVLQSSTPGLTSYRIPVTVLVVPAIAAEPGALKLGVVPAAPAAGPRPRILLNGQSPFKILEVKAGDKQISAKSIYDDSRANHVVEVELKPEAAGEFARDIEIVTDSKDMPSVIVPVSATVKK